MSLITLMNITEHFTLLVTLKINVSEVSPDSMIR